MPDFLKKIYTNGILFYVTNFFNFYLLKFRKTIIKTIKYKSNTIKILLNSSNGTVDQTIMQRGMFGENIIPKIEKELDKTKVFVDVGANIGVFSLILSNYCNKVYSFEPIPAIYNQFKQSIALNHYSNIELHNLGCSNKKETNEITLDPSNAGASTLLSHNNKLSGIKKVIVKLDTLDTILPQEKVDVIKIDVEGYEYFVLLGAEKMISKFKPIIFMEYSPKLYESIDESMSKKIYDFIKANNYSIINLETQKVYSTFEELPTNQCDLIFKHL